MLITLHIANSYKIANHFLDVEATYVSSLKINTISTKKGIATDNIKFSIEKEVLDYLGESFTYLCYDTPIDVYVDNYLLFKGYIDKLNTSSKNTVEIEVKSIMEWQFKQFVSPMISGRCQSQAYSENCTLDKNDFKYDFTTVNIDCFTGAVSLDTYRSIATLGGNSGVGNDIFLDKAMWWNAIVIINGKYRTTVVNVTDENIYLSINYLNLLITTVSLTVYLKCDKTYGECFSKFNNTKNFWGFANTGRKATTIDIFSATELTYCGEHLAETEFVYCATDFSIFGILLTEENNV